MIYIERLLCFSLENLALSRDVATICGFPLRQTGQAQTRRELAALLGSNESTGFDHTRSLNYYYFAIALSCRFISARERNISIGKIVAISLYGATSPLELITYRTPFSCLLPVTTPASYANLNH